MVSASKLATPPGGGAYELPQLTIGVFLADQPNHEVSVGTDRAKNIPLTRDQGFILPAGAEGICSYDREHSFLSVSLNSRILSEAGLTPSAGFAPVFGSLDPLLLHMTKSALDISASGDALYRETMHRALAAHLVQSIAPRNEATAAIDDDRLRRAVSFIQDHLATDISLEKLADEAAMSAFHFARAFKTATGTSPLQYIIAERMKQARILLRTTKLTVAEVAHRVGYEDVSRFGQHFKRATGATPAGFRTG